MRENMIFTQNKEVVMTMDKTVTTVTESVATIGADGKPHLQRARHIRRVERNIYQELRRAA